MKTANQTTNPRTHGLSLFVAAGALAIASVAHAGDINYGDFVTDNMFFTNVTESNTDNTGLFGFPGVDSAGDGLIFPGTGFQSLSFNGGVDFLDGRLTFTVTADPGQFIESITIAESGSFANSGVTAISSVQTIAFVESGGDLYSDTFGQNWNGDSAGDWQDSLTINFAATTSIVLTLDNRLFTSADADDQAYIDKQNISIHVNMVPVPGTLAVLSLAGLGVRRRTRS